MPSRIRTYHLNIAAGLICAATAAYGEDQNPPAPVWTLPQLSEQAIYKGLVGNLLEEVPIEPEKRVQLQRGNAVLSNTLSGRSLAVLLGIASPPLMIAGLLWGIFAASKIGEPTTASAAALVKDDEALDRLIANAEQASPKQVNASGRVESLCPDGGAVECASLADLLQQSPATRSKGKPLDQARLDAAHAQLDAGIAELAEKPQLEAALEPSSAR